MRRRIAQSILKGAEPSTQRAQANEDDDAPMTGSNFCAEKNLDIAYISKLQEIFFETEASYKRCATAHSKEQDISNLHNLFSIYKQLLSLNERDLLEVLLSENYWRGTFGALEYDPEVFMAEREADSNSPLMLGGGTAPLSEHFTQKANFRDFLET